MGRGEARRVNVCSTNDIHAARERTMTAHSPVALAQQNERPSAAAVECTEEFKPYLPCANLASMLKVAWGTARRRSLGINCLVTRQIP